MKNITKRDGRQEPFDKMKIVDAVLASFIDVDGDVSDYAYVKAGNIADYIADIAETEELSIEDIQDLVQKGLMSTKRKDVAESYIIYRHERNKNRALQYDLSERFNNFKKFISGEDKAANTENSNKDTRIVSTMRDYIAGFTCRELADKFYLPKDVSEAHREGIIHFHDSDYSPAMPMHNCCLINLEDMFENGTVISGTLIETPKSFRTACTILTQISAAVASSQYGGQTINLAHLAPFVDISRKKLYKKLSKYIKNVDILNEVVNQELYDEIKDGIQTIQYQLITMSSTNGQAPFCSIFMYLGDAKSKTEENDLALLIEEILKQRIAGVKNEKGVPITTAFPKLLYVLDENNIHENSEYWYLTEIAAECSAKRLVPDYISAKKMRELKGDVFGCMGCRSFLPHYDDGKYWGRFNKGVVTLNLVDIALSSGGDMEKFWEIYDERLELCHKALMIRYKSLKGVKSDVAPILWQHGALARLKPGETIDRLLMGDNSSISLGYAGLYECIKYMTDSNQLEKNGYDFGIEVMKHLNDACDKWNSKLNLGFSVYGSPIESTTDKFSKCLKRRFGEIKDITDKGYITNSYHITPPQEIDAFSKLSIESDFQELSLGGAISYIETPNMEKNVPALLEVIKHIYNTIMYAEINTMTSYCHECGCTDIHMEEDLKFHCPNCGNDDFNKMNIALRVCGYISTNPFAEGRAADIYARTYHLGGND